MSRASCQVFFSNKRVDQNKATAKREKQNNKWIDRFLGSTATAAVAAAAAAAAARKSGSQRVILIDSAAGGIVSVGVSGAGKLVARRPSEMQCIEMVLESTHTHTHTHI